MRKPSATSMRGVPMLSLALLSLAGCGRGDESSSQATTASSSPIAVDGAVVSGSTGMGAQSRELSSTVAPPIADAPMAMEAPVAMDEKAMDAPASAPTPRMSRRAVANVGAAVGAQRGEFSRGDISRGAPLPAIDVTGAMLVRHGQASVQVKTVDAALISVRQTAAQFGGFVANTSLRTGKDEQRSATLELRVPSDKFDGLLAALSGVGKVESVTASAEDVAEEYVDLGARAANARRVEARLVELLATRTGKLSDVLTVEQELARVRMEAERYDARLRWLERRATLSSLDITIHEPIPLLDNPRGPGPIAEALAEAWSRTIGVIAWCIASLGLLIPLAVLILIGVAVARRVLRGGAGGSAGEVAR
jgi:hypothetical protein